MLGTDNRQKVMYPSGPEGTRCCVGYLVLGVLLDASGLIASRVILVPGQIDIY